MCNSQVFGMEMPGKVSNSGSYKYGFSGMEMDNEISGNGNSYTTEFRQYDPRLGRWKSLDNYMMFFPSESPYLYAGNNPIQYIDISGNYRLPANIDESDYPELVKVLLAYDAIVKDKSDADILSNPIVQSMIEWGHFDKEDPDLAKKIREIFSYGSGPIIIPKKPIGTMFKAMGYTKTKKALLSVKKGENYNEFYINNTLIKIMEGKKLGILDKIFFLINPITAKSFKNQPKRAMLSVFFTIGHEDAHLESAKNQVDEHNDKSKKEYGAEFEKAAFPDGWKMVDGEIKRFFRGAMSNFDSYIPKQIQDGVGLPDNYDVRPPTENEVEQEKSRV
ncbi:MAG: hypothetical protein HYR91_13950 [Flavobacteriia bacterium]|nr:hypothetical protein [Flavobacteriia bacterium]